MLVGPSGFALGILIAGAMTLAGAASRSEATPVPGTSAAQSTQGPPAAVLAQIGRLMFFDPSLSASGKTAP